MKLQLTRPLAFIDIEGTGLSPEKDRIVELSITKVFPDESRESRTRRFNPEMPIPAAATEIHGITDEDVKECVNFQHTAKGLFKFIDGCDIAGFASNRYDVPMLYREFLRAGIIWDYKSVRFIDAGNIFKIKEERTLAAALRFYCGKELIGAHGAAADVEATIDVLFAQLEKYEDIPTDLDELQVYCNYGKRILDISGKFTLNDKDEIIINFGQNKGSRAIDEPGLMQWMINKDFAPDTLEICHQILNY